LVAFPITGQAGTLVREVRNVTGATLTKGTVVYINGASGNKPTVAKAIATSDATSAQTFGLIQADISNNSNGYLVAFGDLDGLNTSAFAEGVQLYLSSTTAGGYTSTKQYAPNHLVYIGVVTRQHVNQGRIEVRIQNGYEMDELHDVAAQTPSNNDGLFYNSTNSLWENKSIATALGYTPANSATTLTINGVTFDLSANRTFTVGSVTGTGASGQVAYWTGASAQSGSNDLFWDSATNRLGIGTNVPAYTVDVSGTMRGTGIYYNTGYNISVQRLGFNNGTVGGNFGYIVGSSNGVFRLVNSAESDFTRLQFGGTTSSFPALQRVSNALAVIDGTGAGTSNLLVGSTTDGGQRLQVQGTTLLNGNVTFSSSTGMFWDATNSRLGIGTNVPARQLVIYDGASGVPHVQWANASTGVTNADGFQIRLLSGNQVHFTNFENSAMYFGNQGITGQMTFYPTGNLALGTSASDGGQRLQVQGTTLLNGNVTFSSATGMFWDATNSRLGIGTNAPSAKVQINLGVGSITNSVHIKNSSSTGYSSVTLFDDRDNSAYVGQWGLYGTNVSGQQGNMYFYNTAGGSIAFYTGAGTPSSDLKLRLQTNGNLLLQNGGTFTDSGERLQVTGTMKVTGLSTLSGGITMPNFVTIVSGANNQIGFETFRMMFYTAGNTQNGQYGFQFNGGGNCTLTSGVTGRVLISQNFSPTSGTGEFNTTLITPTINQTGGANGITRGLYVNPTLTSAADFRAIETARGNVVFGNLPTSSAGLPTGAIWNDSGTIKIV
jgi:hypothetical protein